MNNITTHKIHTVIEFIEGNLKEPISSENIAGSASLSLRHLQRTFKEVTGHSVMKYLKNRRLENALHELVSTEKRILDVAVDFQFQSQEVFTRAFRQYFGVSPRTMRSQLRMNQNQQSECFHKDECLAHSRDWFVKKQGQSISHKPWVEC